LRLGLLPPFLLVALGYFSSGLSASIANLHPKTLDLYLYAFDGSLGMQPSFAVGRVVLGSLWLTRMCLFWYRVIPAVLMLVYAQQLVRREEVCLSAFLAFFLAGPAGIIFYNLLPACGPIYLFPTQFPKDAMTVAQIRELFLQPVVIAGNRNAFPSLHMAWALLAWWCGKGLSRWTRTFLALVLGGTVLATLGLGEHYFVDLVAAFPFALMVRAGTAEGIPLSDRQRFHIFVSGALWMAAWVVLLRFGMGIMRTSPLVPWALVACTILCCIVWQARLPSFGRDVEAGSHPVRLCP
jgi:PAP2 superfamily